MKRFLTFALLIFIIYQYNSADAFTEIMDNAFLNVLKGLVNSIQYSQSLVIPQIWLEYRMFIIGGLVAALIVYYLPVWKAYKSLIVKYNQSPETAIKPSLTIAQASYIYLQDQLSTTLVWITQLCQSGILTLHYRSGINPWSISRGPNQQAATKFDQQLLDNLFNSRNNIPLKASLSHPDPGVKTLSETLYEKIKSENSEFMRKKTSSIPAWFLLVCLVIEVPFLNFLYPNTPALIVITLFLLASTFAVVYIVIQQIQNLFNGNYLIAILILAIFFLVTGVFHWGLTGIGNSDFYFFIAFYPDVVVVIATCIYMAPLSPKNNQLLTQIIGYRKHLQQGQSLIKESDLAWTLGLNVHADIVNPEWSYQEPNIPDWLDSDKQNIQTLMNALHSTFPSGLGSAIYGESDSNRKSSSSGIHHDY